MKHALVIGGTGMLSNVSLWLLEKGYHVSIIARNPKRMEKLIEKTKFTKFVTPILVDYTDNKKLQEKVIDTIHQNGHIDVVVAWIHSSGEGALPMIAEEVSKRESEWNLYHVLGSSSNIEAIKRNASMPRNCLYRQVQLGFVIEEAYSRWLTNEEISNGVIDAIQTEAQTITVGVIEPWEKRP